MKKTTTKKHIGTGLKWFGTASILSLALVLTWVLHQHGIEDDVYTNNYTTSVLFSDSLASASGAAPWAMLSLNWFVCRAMIKRWLLFVKKRFE